MTDHWFLVVQNGDRDPKKRNDLFKVIQQTIGGARSPVFCLLSQAPQSSMDVHSLGQYTWELLSLQLVQDSLDCDSSP